ncbi:SAM-dependent methyltransferase [Streptosporangium lutulentum]
MVGLGPAGRPWLTPEAQEALAAADELIGYGPYLDRVPPNPRQLRHPTDNRVEAERAAHALELALAGSRVAVVSSGDPGVFAMASAVLEVACEPRFADVRVRVLPGLTAAHAVASRAGRPWVTTTACCRCRTCSSPGRSSPSGSAPRRRRTWSWRSTTRPPRAAPGRWPPRGPAAGASRAGDPRRDRPRRRRSGGTPDLHHARRARSRRGRHALPADRGVLHHPRGRAGRRRPGGVHPRRYPA